MKTEPDIPTRSPENVRSVGLGPGKLQIQWDPVPKLNYNGPDFQYKVEYCLLADATNNDATNNEAKLCDSSSCKMESELLASPINEFSIPFDKYNAPYAKYAFRIWSQNNQGLGPKPKCKVSFMDHKSKYTHQLLAIIGPINFHQLLEPSVFTQIYL